MTKEAAEAYGYLSRLFKICAPQCEPLPTLLGLCTQIDNLIAGLRERERTIRTEEWKKGWHECHEHYERQRDPWRVRQ